MNLISRVFPSTLYLGLALVNADQTPGIINLLLFVVFSFLAVALAWFTGEKSYFKGLVGSGETTARRKTLNDSDYKRMGMGRPALLAYWAKEIRLLLRNPTYFMNCVVTNLLVPVLLAVPFLIQSHNQKGSMPWEALVDKPAGHVVLMAAITGVVIFMAGSNAITATSLSREGKEFYISKYIPLPYKIQVQAKLLSAYVFGILGAVLLIIAATILMHLKIPFIGALLGVSLVAIVPVIEAGLLIDLARPKLEWENEAQASKQNLNVILSMIFSVLLGGVILSMIVRFVHTFALAAWCMLFCFGAAALVLYYLLTTWGVKRYQELEG